MKAGPPKKTKRGRATDQPLAIEYRPLSDLIPNEANARMHPDAQIEQIARSIRRFGFVNPILLDEKLVIVAGHGRRLAAQRVGLESVPTIVIPNLSEKARRELALADNRIPQNSGWDQDLLRAELEAISQEGTDPEELGFESVELDKLFAEPEPLAIEEISVSDVYDTFWISVRGPLKHQAEALRRLRAALDDLGDVEVELGTIAIDG